MAETLKETIAQFEHMGVVLSDPEWRDGSFAYSVAHKLWMAAKAGQAEIDGLTAQLAAQVEITNIATTEQHYLEVPARIDDVRDALAQTTRERDIAKRDAEILQRVTDEIKRERDEARAEVERLGMACGMAYCLPGAGNVQVDPTRPVEKMQEICAAVIAYVERLAALSPIKVGDISITLGLTETGEARMTFDGADDATLAVVAGKFALAMQAIMDDAK